MNDSSEEKIVEEITPAQAGRALNLLVANRASIRANRIATLLMQQEKLDHAIQILRLNDYCGQCVLALLNGELTRGQKMSFRYTLLCLLGDDSVTKERKTSSEGLGTAQDNSLSEFSARIDEIRKTNVWFMEAHIGDFAKDVGAYLDAFLIRYPADGKGSGGTSLDDDDSAGDEWKKGSLIVLDDEDDLAPPKMVRGHDLNVLVHVINMLEAYAGFLDDLIAKDKMEAICLQKEKIWIYVEQVLSKMMDIQSRLYDYSGHDFFDDLMTNLGVIIVELSRIKMYLHSIK